MVSKTTRKASRPSAYKIIVAARKLINKPDKWTKGAYARNSQGIGANFRSDAAVCFCAVGALNRAIYDMRKSYPDADRQHTLINSILNYFCFSPLWTLVGINDRETTTHKDIMKLFSDATKRAKEAEKASKE